MGERAHLIGQHSERREELGAPAHFVRLRRSSRDQRSQRVAVPAAALAKGGEGVAAVWFADQIRIEPLEVGLVTAENEVVHRGEEQHGQLLFRWRHPEQFQDLGLVGDARREPTIEGCSRRRRAPEVAEPCG